MKPKIEYWFDFSCPFAYLGSVGIEALAERVNADLELKPMLLGGVFRARNVPQNLAASVSEAKARHNLNDMNRFARAWGVPFEMPNGHPLRTVNALRAVLAAGKPYSKLMHAFYRAYWVQGIDISLENNLRRILQEAGYEPDPIMTAIGTERIKSELFACTDEAIKKGVFGAPGIVVDGALFWGQDRMNMVERFITGSDDTPTLNELVVYNTDFYFDYASPFAFLAAKQVESLFGDKLRYCPMFLGGVWKANNPRAFEINPHNPKRAYLGTDFRRQAQAQGVSHRWPSLFPIKTTLPLRVTLLANNEPALINAIFDAYWRKDQDISNAKVVENICNEVGLDGARLVSRAREDDAKKDLRDATQLAIDSDVFGAPTTVVHLKDGKPALYWGNDRLWMAALAARGDRKVI